jgi:hypothetical protein
MAMIQVSHDPQGASYWTISVAVHLDRLFHSTISCRHSNRGAHVLLHVCCCSAATVQQHTCKHSWLPDELLKPCTPQNIPPSTSSVPAVSVCSSNPTKAAALAARGADTPAAAKVLIVSADQDAWRATAPSGSRANAATLTAATASARQGPGCLGLFGW